MTSPATSVLAFLVCSVALFCILRWTWQTARSLMSIDKERSLEVGSTPYSSTILVRLRRRPRHLIDSIIVVAIGATVAGLLVLVLFVVVQGE